MSIDVTTIIVAVRFRVSWHQSNSTAHISESWQLPGCKCGPEAGNSKLHGEFLQAKPNTATRGICVRTIVKGNMRKEVETHNPKWEEVYEGSGVEMSDQGVLNLRWIAEAYLWRETGSWNGVNSTGTLRKLSRWPAACSVGAGLLQKPMLRVMSEIRRREHGGVKDKAVNSGKKSYEPTETVRYKCHQIHWQKLEKLVVKLQKRSYQASHWVDKAKYA